MIFTELTLARIMRLYKQGLTDQEICAKIKCTREAITIWRNKRKLPPNKSVSGYKRTESQIATMQSKIAENREMMKACTPRPSCSLGELEKRRKLAEKKMKADFKAGKGF